MSNDRTLQKLFLENIGLISSYVFDEAVTLNSVYTESENDFSEESLDSFLCEIRTRHAIACLDSLQPILQYVGNQISGKSILKRSESKDLNHGKLDVNRYVQRHMNYGFRNQNFPILETFFSAQTPENILVVKILKQLQDMLNSSPFRRNSAEGLKVAVYQNWLYMHLRKWPWNEIKEYGDIRLLTNQTEQRLLKRRTGNEVGYNAIVDWLKEFKLDPARLRDLAAERFIKGILSFPTGDFFWEKVLEIWSLTFVAKTLTNLNFTILSGPEPLSKRHLQPIYQFKRNDEIVNVWFQRQVALGNPRWFYASGKAFRGIPDIVLESTKRAPLIVDAKHKLKSGTTSSEDTYKVLGYLENFKIKFLEKRFHAALIISSYSHFETFLHSQDGDSITLLGITESIEDRPRVEATFRSVLEKWLL